MTTEHHSRGWSWRASGATVPVAALLIVSVILPLVVSVVAGSLELPRNDDWSYRHIALDLARTGSFSLDGISETMIIGQILFTQPFLWLSGSQPSAFVVAGVIFAVAGALSAFAMARSLLTTREAALAAASLALFPGYLAYATSYMSDVPALALQFSCLAVGMFAIRDERQRIRWLVVSGAIGIAAFSIREFSIAAPASILLAAVLVDPRRWRVWALAVAVAAICVAIHLWRGSLPGQLPAIAAGYGSFSGATQAFSSVALVLAPFALLGARAWRPHLRRLDMIVGLAIGAGLAGGRLIQWAREGTVPPVTLNNMASQFGVPARDYLVGGRPLLFDEPAWTVLNIVALVGTVVVLTIGAGIIGAVLRANGTSLRTLIRAFGSPAGSLVLFVLAMTFGLVLFGLSRPLFDRYFWPVVPPAAVLLLYVPRRVSNLEPDPGTPRSSVALKAVGSGIPRRPRRHIDDLSRQLARLRCGALVSRRASRGVGRGSGSGRRRLRVGRFACHDARQPHDPDIDGHVLPKLVAVVLAMWRRQFGTDGPAWMVVDRDDDLRPQPARRPVGDAVPVPGRLARLPVAAAIR